MPNTSIPATGEAMPSTLAEAIAYHEAKHALWTATAADGDLPVDTPESSIAMTAEDFLVAFPCRNHDDVRVKVEYLYNEATPAARGACEAAFADFDTFLGSLLCAAPSLIPDMYAEWLAIRHKPFSERTEEELNEEPSRYQVLQERILAATPQTPRDVAIMFLVDIDDGDSYHSDVFEARIRELATGEAPMRDPLLAAIEAYRAKVIVLAETDTSHCTSLDEENAVFHAIYGQEQDVLTDAAPMPTSIAGVREAIRLAIDEDAICDQVAEGPLRAALAYLDGRAAV